MTLAAHKTKIVCTIGPASSSYEVIRDMIREGMNIARLNFSHGDFEDHRQIIRTIRGASRDVGYPVAIMADFPGPKIRIGQIAGEPVELQREDTFTLTTQEVMGDRTRAFDSFDRLTQAVRPGDLIFLNDGIIQLEVKDVGSADVLCHVIVGGELRSRKGVNLPGIDLGISAFTDRDKGCLKFALEEGVDAISQSFVESAADVKAVREFAAALGHHPFVIAKIERSRALDHIDEIIEFADGIMVARGDLGVEIPIEGIAVAQKNLIRKANISAKPVITATQMLESMTGNRRPTRAEATDVANAILDGTDCVMLSEESAMGKYPVEAVSMLGKIAASIEPHRPEYLTHETIKSIATASNINTGDLIALSLQSATARIAVAAVIVPSGGGTTARRLARLRLPVWIAAASPREVTCRNLQFSYGVTADHISEGLRDWDAYGREWVQTHHMPGKSVILIEGLSPMNPRANHKFEVIDLSATPSPPNQAGGH
ncbi:MAG: Pyruvate kinase [Syntrophorhabdus sp. PtaB.Bin006]|nr:MAG: Pyruvate kinase [Syntrophorhabdus sp. PtaB.Bin006]